MIYKIDWDNDGKVTGKDNAITWAILDAEEKKNGGGSCLVSVLLVPVITFLLAKAIKGVIH